AAHPGLYRLVGFEQTLLGRALERRAVEVALTEVGLPSVGVRDELTERQRAVLAGEDAELRQCDRVVAAEDEREDACLDERRERGLDAPEGLLGVAGRHRQVAVVDDRERLDDVEP